MLRHPCYYACNFLSFSLCRLARIGWPGWSGQPTGRQRERREKSNHQVNQPLYSIMDCSLLALTKQLNSLVIDSNDTNVYDSKVNAATNIAHIIAQVDNENNYCTTQSSNVNAMNALLFASTSPPDILSFLRKSVDHEFVTNKDFIKV